MNKYYSYFSKNVVHQVSQAKICTLKNVTYKIKQEKNITIISFFNILASFHELGESGIPKFSNHDVILVLLILCTICGSTQSLF